MNKLDPRHKQTRGALRWVGVSLVVVGGIFTVIGLASFFAAFGEALHSVLAQ